MKVVENCPQNARNCTILKNFLRGACPKTPLAKARSFAARDMPLRGMYIQNPRNFKVGPPPLTNPAYAPGHNITYYDMIGQHMTYYDMICSEEVKNTSVILTIS